MPCNWKGDLCLEEEGRGGCCKQAAWVVARTLSQP